MQVCGLNETHGDGNITAHERGQLRAMWVLLLLLFCFFSFFGDPISHYTSLFFICMINCADLFKVHNSEITSETE